MLLPEAARAVQAQPSKLFSHEAAGHTRDPASFYTITPGERLRFLEYRMNEQEGRIKDMQAQLKELRDMKEELGEIRDDVHTLVRWRRAVISCTAAATAAVGLAATYIGFIAEAAARS